MEVLYSLYDALVSIDIPGDRARAVVKALETDLSATLATKADFQILKQELQAEIQGIDRRVDALSHKVDALANTLIIRLGVLMCVIAGILFAALEAVLR